MRAIGIALILFGIPTPIFTQNLEDISRRERPILTCAVWAAHAFFPDTRDQAPQMLAAWLKLAEPAYAFIWPELSQDLGSYEDSLSDANHQFAMGMAFAQVSAEVERQLRDEAPFGDGLSFNQVIEQRSFIAQRKFREQNCEILLP